MDEMSTTRRARGSPSTLASFVCVGAPPRRTEKSALVPPISNVTRSRIPRAFAKATAAETPPAGPERASSIGRSMIWRDSAVPPPDFITRNRAPTALSREFRWSRTSGFTYASNEVVEARSYSRNSAWTLEEIETSKCASRALRRVSSWRGFANEKRRQTATDSAPIALMARTIRRTSDAGRGLIIRPPGPTRSRAPTLSPLGTTGSGRVTRQSYSEGRF